ncbi:hypothetical protein LZQ00_06325 [Sphingobacterium sp. SRCM116780]|uniref:hypothetical protein n=1 Tax=Sphingobacterium sp. SRCM116780 TaxID=2907623 RepID=UPI001F2926C2|nr:hypothetical protein [Sphingobacterium sp. SRCM116780]UIR57430.1 hypothetical protein LZQ00_06325 [Sphingobacterium sp. SRCM116780]
MIQQILLITGIAILSVVLVDTFGSIASRKFQFNYGFFFIFSCIIYFLTGYFLSSVTSSNWMLLLSGLVGLFDGTVGLKISLKLKANSGNVDYDKMKHRQLLPIVAFAVAMLIGCIGSLLPK